MNRLRIILPALLIVGLLLAGTAAPVAAASSHEARVAAALPDDVGLACDDGECTLALSLEGTPALARMVGSIPCRPY